MNYYLYLSLWAEHKGAPGLALYELDSVSGKARFIRKENDELSFGCSHIDLNNNLIYLCNETARTWGVPGDSGKIYIYRINAEDGSLTELSSTLTFCSNPCYIHIDKERSIAAVGNYGQGGFLYEFIKDGNGKCVPELRDKKSYLQLYRLNEDGNLGDLTDVKEHAFDIDNSFMGSNINCVQISPCGRFLAVANKGNGRLYLYKIDHDAMTLTLCSEIMTEAGGASPRYALFHPSLPLIFVNQEKEKHGRMLLSTFTYDDNGMLSKASTVDVLPVGFQIPPMAHFEQQGMVLSSDGSYLYTELKGPDCICVMKTSADGSLEIIQHVAVDGEWPRGLAMTPDGKCLVASAHCSGEINVYLINENGTLERSDVVYGPIGGSNMSFYPINL